MKRFRRRLVWLQLLLLTAIWVALWGDLTVGNVLAGVLVALVAVAAFPFEPGVTEGRLRPWPAVRFGAYFLKELGKASAIVAWEVVTPQNSIEEGIVAIELHEIPDHLVAVIANSISLTPGTLTIEVRRDPPVLYVHVLHLDDVEALRREMRHLEALAIRAFGSDEVVAILDAEADAGRAPIEEVGA